jgi:hypothetical protein
MFSVIFEVLPNKENWDDYLDNAKMLRPELEKVEGFVDNIRYKSFTPDPFAFELAGREVGCPLAHAQTPSRGPAEGPRRNLRRLPFARRPDHCRQSSADRICSHGAAARRDRSRGRNHGHADQRDASRSVEADQQSVRLRRVARPEPVGRRQYVVGHFRGHTYARRPASPATKPSQGETRL